MHSVYFYIIHLVYVSSVDDAGEASPFLRDQCVLLAILPTGDVLA